MVSYLHQELSVKHFSKLFMKEKETKFRESRGRCPINFNDACLWCLSIFACRLRSIWRLFLSLHVRKHETPFKCYLVERLFSISVYINMYTLNFLYIGNGSWCSNDDVCWNFDFICSHILNKSTELGLVGTEKGREIPQKTRHKGKPIQLFLRRHESNGHDAASSTI